MQELQYILVRNIFFSKKRIFKNQPSITNFLTNKLDNIQLSESSIDTVTVDPAMTSDTIMSISSSFSSFSVQDDISTLSNNTALPNFSSLDTEVNAPPNTTDNPASHSATGPASNNTISSLFSTDAVPIQNILNTPTIIPSVHFTQNLTNAPVIVHQISPTALPPKSILKNVNNKNVTNTQTRSVIFQHTIKIPDEIVGTWRRSRTSLSNSMKAELRAEHFATLRGQNLPTLWAVGIGRMPNFLPVDDQARRLLIQSKRDHAMRSLQIMEASLRRKSTVENNLGSTFRTAVATQYDNPELSGPAIDLLDTLIVKDRATTATVLNARLASLQSTPPTDDQILATMTVDPNNPTPPASAGNAIAPPPPPTTRGRGRGNATRGAFNVNQRDRSRSPNTRPNRGRGRGRGASRGRGRGGTTPTSRSTSPANRLAQRVNNVQALSAVELLWINSLRSANGQPPLPPM